MDHEDSADLERDIMNFGMIRVVFFPVLLSASMAAASTKADTPPSFDCGKATSAVERAICAHANLARLDRQLANEWRPLIRAYNDDEQIAHMKLDQTRWLAARNGCGSDVECIEQKYHDRINLLSGSDPTYPAAGVFDAKHVGTFALYPLSGEYLVSIQTAEPTKGTWTCEVVGRAKGDAGALRVAFGTFSFPAVLRDARTLVVESGKDVSEAAANACGLNGTFAFAYTRRATADSH